MSKKFKSQASSARAASTLGGFGAFQTNVSPLSYITEAPDLSQIPEPNVVVSLKNLSKKDSTTKAKALEELLDVLKDNADVSVLAAWSELYPRTAIDNSQIVRRSAHTLTGVLAANAKKTIAPLLHKIVPSWLAGTYDNDKSVAKAAVEALERAIPTPDKRDAVWTLYKDAIYDRVEDSILYQSSSTLSDERTTSPDEAETKYVRVVGTALRLLSRLLRSQSVQADILQEKKLWELINHEDAYLRNGICDLMSSALAQHAKELDWNVISTTFVYKALNKSQMGSARAYTQTLLSLTRARPSLWTSDYTGKTTVLKRLCQFLRQGSQNGPPDVWSLLKNLVQTIPLEAWKGGKGDVEDLVAALRAGVLTERLNYDAAWDAYLEICAWSSTLLQDEDEKFAFINQNVVPVVLAYINRTSDEKWRISGKTETTAIKALSLVATQQPSLQKTWEGVVDGTIEKLRLSLPESSKDFKLSQDAVGSQGQRLLTLERAVYKTNPEAKTVIEPLDINLLHAALDLLKSRNGKPYGATAIVTQLAGNGFSQNAELLKFLSTDAENLLDSPSCKQLVTLSAVCNRSLARKLLLWPPTKSTNIEQGLLHLFRTGSMQDLEEQDARNLVIDRIDNSEDDLSRQYTVAILSNNSIKDGQLRTELLSRIPEDLSTEGEQEIAIAMLEAILSDKSAPQILDDNAYKLQLVSSLLLLADSDAAISERAGGLINSLNHLGGEKTNPLPIIREQLRGKGKPLAILTLIDLAKDVVNKDTSFDFLPDPEDWKTALHPHLNTPTHVDLSITSPLQGAVFQLQAEHPDEEVVRDAEEFSLLFRLAFYATRISGQYHQFDLESVRVQALYEYLPVALQLINEKITLDDANSLWLGTSEEVETAAADILSQGMRLVESWQNEERFMHLWISKMKEITGQTREAYLWALAAQSVVSRYAVSQASQVMQSLEERLRAAHKSDDILSNASLFSTVKDTYLSSQAGVRTVNEYITDATQSRKDIHAVILLNVLLSDDTTVLEKVQQLRLVSLLKAMVQQAGLNEIAGQMSESLKLVRVLVDSVQDVYGEHWEQLIKNLITIWSTVTIHDMPTLRASLLVYAKLKTLVDTEDVNDDLKDAWLSSKGEFEAGLIRCLKLFGTPTNGPNQPRFITASLLSRQIRSGNVSTAENVFELLGSDEKIVQDAAYDILHRQIPPQQEQLSIDLALEQRPVHLPEEIMSLVADVSDPRRYLLSWKILFDHYPKASYSLQEVYTADLKRSDHIHILLDFVCDRLRLTSGRPLDATKFDIVEYMSDTAESDEKDVQWLSIHVYFLALVYVPSLVKDWYLQQKNRIKTPLESWTQKYMTSLIVAASLITVEDWSAAQSKDEGDRPVDVKASPKAAEIVASIAVDPESPPISLSIHLPSAYPLDSPIVTSRTRVGVSEKNWNSWLRTIQIIIFSSGSVVEGLIAFRRNVQGALKGQSECAICYSIIGTDMQTPSKKCGTCKNMFHGVCLFRWFKSSNSSSCPLCRNNFNYA